jgi:hypothetical protein
MAAAGLKSLTTAELLDELEHRLLASRTAANGTGPEHKVHCSFSADGEGAAAPHILRVRMELAGLAKGSFSTAFGTSADVVESWLDGTAPVPAWVIPAIRMYEMLSDSERQKVLRTPAARAGKRTGNTHPFACIEEL